jgi:hypothetical protein
MSSILNSISAGDLQVQKAPEIKPVKEDSIIDLLQGAEIEFETCPKIEEKFENINTGFGDQNDLYFETKCKPKLNTPLYRDNYLREFASEEEKAAARHALGLYNKGDVVAMSLLTAEDNPPSDAEWNEAGLQQLRKGDKFFVPYTAFTAVFDSAGNTLEHRMVNVHDLITQQQKEIAKINAVSTESNISSLGDIRLFLQGFNNGDNLHTTLDVMNKEMLRFEQTGQI